MGVNLDEKFYESAAQTRSATNLSIIYTSEED